MARFGGLRSAESSRERNRRFVEGERYEIGGFVCEFRGDGRRCG